MVEVIRQVERKQALIGINAPFSLAVKETERVERWGNPGPAEHGQYERSWKRTAKRNLLEMKRNTTSLPASLARGHLAMHN